MPPAGPAMSHAHPAVRTIDPAEPRADFNVPPANLFLLCANLPQSTACRAQIREYKRAAQLREANGELYQQCGREGKMRNYGGSGGERGAKRERWVGQRTRGRGGENVWVGVLPGNGCFVLKLETASIVNNSKLLTTPAGVRLPARVCLPAGVSLPENGQSTPHVISGSNTASFHTLFIGGLRVGSLGTRANSSSNQLPSTLFCH
eukprot:366221-Chlamydomonas_euryale.AAC.6